MSWKNLQITIGHGSTINENVIVSADGSQNPREINYIGFASFGAFTHSWKYNNGKLSYGLTEKYGFKSATLLKVVLYREYCRVSTGSG